MNIVYVHTHDTGKYIEPYGHRIPTPHLMQLAQEGTLFRQAFSTAPTCSPSRAGLLTGRTPHACGMMGLAHLGHQLHDPTQHLAHYLTQHGYETVLCGFQHETAWSEPRHLGYQRILEQEVEPHVQQDLTPTMSLTERDLRNTQLAVDYIRARPLNKPFFLSFGLLNTHRSFPDVADESAANYVLPPAPLADRHIHRKDMAAYIASTGVVDQCLGQLLSALRDSGLDDHTMLIFTTDHGLAFPLMKCNLTDSGIGVSLIIRYPQHRARGQVIDALVSQLDVFPTICEWLHLDRPRWLEGHSLLPLMEGICNQIRHEIFAEVNTHIDLEPMRCVRTDRFKLIAAGDQALQRSEANMDSGFSKESLIAQGFLHQSREPLALYDLFFDPLETNNVIHDPRYASIASDLKNRLQTWMIDTEDPYLEPFKEILQIL